MFSGKIAHMLQHFITLLRATWNSLLFNSLHSRRSMQNQLDNSRSDKEELDKMEAREMRIKSMFSETTLFSQPNSYALADVKISSLVKILAGYVIRFFVLDIGSFIKDFWLYCVCVICFAHVCSSFNSNLLTWRENHTNSNSMQLDPYTKYTLIFDQEVKSYDAAQNYLQSKGMKNKELQQFRNEFEKHLGASNVKGSKVQMIVNLYKNSKESVCKIDQLQVDNKYYNVIFTPSIHKGKLSLSAKWQKRLNHFRHRLDISNNLPDTIQKSYLPGSIKQRALKLIKQNNLNITKGNVEVIFASPSVNQSYYQLKLLLVNGQYIKKKTKNNIKKGLIYTSKKKQFIELGTRNIVEIKTKQVKRTIDEAVQTAGTDNNSQIRLSVPVPGARISSGYGYRTKPRKAFHHGIDYAAPQGTKVLSAASGKVISCSRLGGYGNVIMISHGTYSTIYAHLYKFCISAGTRVEAGQVIGQVGRTGRATGAHLHFECRVNNKSIDPAKILNSRGVTMRKRTIVDNIYTKHKKTLPEHPTITKYKHTLMLLPITPITA